MSYRGRSGSTRRLANRSTTSTRLDEYLSGDLWPSLEHEQVSHMLHRKDRLLGLVPDRRMENITDPYLANDIGQCRQRLTENGLRCTTQEKIKKSWAAILHQSIDGSSLKNPHQVTGQHQWVADGTSLLLGRNYINCHNVRIGALPTRSRTTSGRRGDRLSRGVHGAGN